MRGDIRCVEGRSYRHDPQHDDPDLETDMGECRECSGRGCAAARGRRIITHFVHPPIPVRDMDWQAHFDGDEPDDDGRMMCGHGATEAQAIADLLEWADVHG